MRKRMRVLIKCAGRTAIPVGLAVWAVAAGGALASEVAAGGLTLRSVNVEWPDNDRTFPPAAGVDVVTQNCTGCHSANMVLTQPVLSAATWQAEVEKMRKLYKAPVAEAAVPTIVSYLSGMQAAMPANQ